eukprot:4917111-Pyramimonas_sp.AAC.2
MTAAQSTWRVNVIDWRGQYSAGREIDAAAECTQSNEHVLRETEPRGGVQQLHRTVMTGKQSG